MRVMIISDTHNMLRPEVIEKLSDCDVILHAGDISKAEILEEIRKYAPVHVVRGNNDRGEWGMALPLTLEFELEGIRFFMTHKPFDVPSDIGTRGVDVVICGHTHRYDDHEEQGIRFLNPGSCGPRRFTQPITMMTMTIGEGRYEITKVEIPRGPSKSMVEHIPGDMPMIVNRVVRDIKKKKTVPEIAERNGISPELAEKIVRLYLTHPGVDTEGIVKKMGI